MALFGWGIHCKHLKSPALSLLTLNEGFTMNVDQLLVSASVVAALSFFVLRKIRAQRSGAKGACSAGCGCATKGVQPSGSSASKPAPPFSKQDGHP